MSVRYQLEAVAADGTVVYRRHTKLLRKKQVFLALKLGDGITTRAMVCGTGLPMVDLLPTGYVEDALKHYQAVMNSTNAPWLPSTSWAGSGTGYLGGMVPKRRTGND